MNARRVAGGWFALIVLYTALTQSDKIAALLGTTTAATQRLSDPTVALIRNRAAGGTAAKPAAVVKPATGQPGGNPLVATPV